MDQDSGFFSPMTGKVMDVHQDGRPRTLKRPRNASELNWSAVRVQQHRVHQMKPGCAEHIASPPAGPHQSIRS